MIFSPSDSLVKQQFQAECRAKLGPPVETSWDRWLMTLHGHMRPVLSVAFSHDSKLIASTSEDCTIRLWDVSEVRCVQILEFDSWVCRAAFSPDSSILVAVAAGSIHAWDVATGQHRWTRQGDSRAITGFSFFHDSKRLAYTTERGIEIWDLDGTRTTIIPFKYGPISLKVSDRKSVV